MNTQYAKQPMVFYLGKTFLLNMAEETKDLPPGEAFKCKMFYEKGVESTFRDMVTIFTSATAQLMHRMGRMHVWQLMSDVADKAKLAKQERNLKTLMEYGDEMCALYQEFTAD